jgi:8-oxo-dGTP diphosphatase
MDVQKAGCILLDIKNKRIGLVYRTKRKDYSFPKGHLEIGETIEECAIRETEEETGRQCHIIPSKELPVIKYIDSLGDKSEVHYYLASDDGKSTKMFKQEDVEELVWTPFDEVEDTLSYQNLKDFWNKIKPIVDEIVKQ